MELGSQASGTDTGCERQHRNQSGVLLSFCEMTSVTFVLVTPVTTAQVNVRLTLKPYVCSVTSNLHRVLSLPWPASPLSGYNLMDPEAQGRWPCALLSPECLLSISSLGKKLPYKLPHPSRPLQFPPWAKGAHHRLWGRLERIRICLDAKQSQKAGSSVFPSVTRASATSPPQPVPQLAPEVLLYFRGTEEPSLKWPKGAPYYRRYPKFTTNRDYQSTEL